MNTFEFDINYALPKNKKRIIVLGKFQSFHIAHQKILKKTIEIGRKKELETIAMIFSDFNGFNRKYEKNIFNQDNRINFLNKFGFSHVMIFEANSKTFSISGINFINFLKNNLNVSDIVVGEDFKFGNKKNSDVEDLKNFFKVNIIPLIKINNQSISTSLTKLLIYDQDFKNLKKILGFNWFYKGEVIYGHGRGKKLGFPTANVEYPKGTISIPNGLYYSNVILENKKYYALTSISNNPTFNDLEKSYESYLINYKGYDFYEKEIIVEILEFKRNQIKFNNIEDLKEKMLRDKEEAIKYFTK